MGKTTCSLIFGIKLSKQNRVKVVSIDPASNIGDILLRKIKRGKDIRIKNNLTVKEIDTENIIKKLKDEIKDSVETSFKELRVINLENMLNLIDHVPGVEEEAILHEVDMQLKDYNREQILIFDSPPTALFLKFISLLISSREWLKVLIKLRESINKEKKMLRMEEQDSIYPLLLKKYENLERLLLILKESSYMVVRDSSPVSQAEAIRIERHLKNLGFKNIKRIYNRTEGNDGCTFPELKNPYGYENLASCQIQYCF